MQYIIKLAPSSPRSTILSVFLCFYFALSQFLYLPFSLLLSPPAPLSLSLTISLLLILSLSLTTSNHQISLTLLGNSVVFSHFLVFAHFFISIRSIPTFSSIVFDHECSHMRKNHARHNTFGRFYFGNPWDITVATEMYWNRLKWVDCQTKWKNINFETRSFCSTCRDENPLIRIHMIFFFASSDNWKLWLSTAISDFQLWIWFIRLTTSKNMWNIPQNSSDHLCVTENAS